MKINKQDVVSYLKNMFMVICGTAVLAFGTAIFIVPFELVTGGVSGIAIVLTAFIRSMFGVTFTDEFLITTLTWLLFFLGLLFLGKDFAAKTLVSTIFYPIFYVLFSGLVNINVLNGAFVLKASNYQDIAVLLASTLGGAFVGAGCAITFKAGGSTGGVDVLSFLFVKIFKKIKSSYIFFAIDATIVILGILVINDIVLSLLGIISALICSFVIDKLFLGVSDAYFAQIVSDKSDDICQGVIEKLDRTATIVDVVGGYSKMPKKMLIVSFSMREYSMLMTIINSADPNAFVTISRTHENRGEGWTRDKT